MRVLVLLVVSACLGGPAYRLTVRGNYEVGEDPTIGVAIRETTADHAVLIVTRPDGSTVRTKVPLSVAQTNVRLGGPAESGSEPVFTTPGDYRVELRGDGTILAKQEIRISVDRLTKIFDDDEIADYKLVARYTRARAHKKQQWKTYGALFEHTLRKDVQLHVVIEEPGGAMPDAWKQYEEEGTLGVIENHNVRFRERTGSVSASWISGKYIVALRAATLADFERGFIGDLLERYPSDLDAR
ncbi:MAG TPA: hypothetical protein VIV11_20290 [Kofleriaceae bacterium]